MMLFMETRNEVNMPTLEDALRLVRTIFGFQSTGVRNGHRGPIAHVGTYNKGVPAIRTNAILFYKTDWFRTFSRELPQWPPPRGVGQTCDVALLDEMSILDADVLIVMPERPDSETLEHARVYQLSANTWITEARRMNSLRIPRRETELMASVPSRMLERIL